MKRLPHRPVLRTTEGSPAAPRQARSLNRRRKLLAAGRFLFAEHGFEATSIEQITAQAGAATGAFYQHFRSKKQFLVALMDELLERLSRLDLQLRPGGDLRISLREFLAAVFRTDVESYGVVRAWQEAALTDAGLGQMQRKIESWTSARVLALFRSLRKHPQARPHRDLSAFARMMDRHFWSLLARGASLPPRKLNREVIVAADVIYRYLFRDS